MGNNNLLYSVTIISELIIDVAKNPSKLFLEIKEGKRSKETILVFIVSFFITLIKSFFTKRRISNFNVFENGSENKIMTFLFKPPVSLIEAYIFYFFFLILTIALLKLFDNRIRFKPIALSLMAISALGVMTQIAFLPLRIAPTYFHTFGSWIVTLWMIILSVKSIKTSSDLSVWKAALCFIIALLPYFFLSGISAPYFAWL